MMPSPADLTYFIEIAFTQNLSRAASRLGITQPSLSLALQRLEGNMGLPLVIRSPRGVSLTPAGERLLLHARGLLQEWEKVRSKAVESHTEVVGPFSIGCHASVALYSLPSFLPRLVTDHPLLEISLRHDLSRNIVDAVIGMKVDVGIVVNPVRHPDLIIKKIFTDEVTFWSSSNPSQLQDPHSGDGVLLCDVELLQTQSLIKKMKRSEIRYGRLLPSSNLEVVAALTAAGAGIGILPTRVATRLAETKLKRITRAPTFEDEVCLVYRVENREIKAIQTIAETAVRALTSSK